MCRPDNAIKSVGQDAIVAVFRRTYGSSSNTYEYDKAGRVVSLRQFGTTGGNTVGEKRVGITYDPLSRFETITRYEDFLDTEMVATSTYGFDSAGRLDSLTHVGPGAESLADYAYTHDKLGRILTFDLTSAERPNDDESATYTYDATNQLTDADYDYQDDENYDYDLNGNRINNAFESGTNNQHYSDGRYTYEYDDEGNRIRKYALHVLATGADQGGGPHVLVHDGSVPTRPEIGSFYAYNPAFAGGVRVAVGDVTGDGIPDIITSPGTGGNGHVKVFDGTTLEQAAPAVPTQFHANHGLPTFTGDYYIAVGDVVGNSDLEIIVSAGTGSGGQSLVRIYDKLGNHLHDIVTYNTAFNGGVRITVGDTDNDGQGEIITAPGAGGGPVVKIWNVTYDGSNYSQTSTAFGAYNGALTTGLYLTSGDVNGDGYDDIITAPGAGGGPVVRVFKGQDSTLLTEFGAYSGTTTNGVRVAVTDTNDLDAHADIVTVTGPGIGSEVRVFDYNSSGNNFTEVYRFTAYSGFLGGTFVGGHENEQADNVVYDWDHMNQLTSVKYYDFDGVLSKEVQYDYDAFGRRIEKRVDENGDGTFTRGEQYVYDHSGKIDPATGVPLDDVVLVFDLSDQLQERFLHGPAIDQVFASEDSMGDILWGLTDHQGTIRDIAKYDDVANSTDIANHRQFDAFGNITDESDPSKDFHYSYTGRIYDEDVGLYYYRARWYDPKAGRFVSEDPIGFNGGDFNLNRYVRNASLNLVDASGLEPTRAWAKDFSELYDYIKKREDTLRDENGDKLTPKEILVRVRDGLKLTNSGFLSGSNRKIESFGWSYVYTEKAGWIDLPHFFEAARVCQVGDKDSPAKVFLVAGTNVGGVGVELLQGVLGLFLHADSATSFFGPEDLSSNFLGSIFGATVTNDRPLSEQVRDFFCDLKPLPPKDAPDYNDLTEDQLIIEKKWNERNTIPILDPLIPDDIHEWGTPGKAEAGHTEKPDGPPKVVGNHQVPTPVPVDPIQRHERKQELLNYSDDDVYIPRAIDPEDALNRAKSFSERVRELTRK